MCNTKGTYVVIDPILAEMANYGPLGIILYLVGRDGYKWKKNGKAPGVTKEVCDALHGNTVKQLDRIERKLDLFIGDGK